MARPSFVQMLRGAIGWWLLPIVLVGMLVVVALMGDSAPVRMLVYSVM